MQLSMMCRKKYIPETFLNETDMFSLIELPYGLSELEPMISAKTLEFHHGKHLKGYVDNLNKLIAGTVFENLPLEEIVRRTAQALAAGDKSFAAIFNNAGQTLNHNLYFTQFTAPHGGSSGPDRESPLAKQLLKQWQSLEAFQEEFAAKGTGLFGSGWVWLSASPEGELVITQEAGASNPVTRGFEPLLTFDVWEHAYYLDYQNRRPDHLKTLWGIVDWKVVEKRYKS